MVRKISINSAKTSMIVALFEDITPTTEGIVPVSTKEIKQRQSSQRHPAETKVDANGVYMRGHQILVSSEANSLKLHDVLEAYCEDQGNEPYEATLEIIQCTYRWNEMEHDVIEIIQACIPCIILLSSVRTPRPPSAVLCVKKPNKVVYADSLYTKPSRNNSMTYILLSKDGLSTYP